MMAIDSKSLMLGDWVRRRWTCSDTGREVVKDFQLTAIQKIGESLYAWSKNGNMGRVEQLEPIPLTSEILEKNGFARDEIAGWRFRQYEDGLGLIYEIYWNNKGDELEIVSNFSKIGGFDKKGIQFVHQLQNALRLCGIEKEIKL